MKAANALSIVKQQLILTVNKEIKKMTWNPYVVDDIVGIISIAKTKTLLSVIDDMLEMYTNRESFNYYKVQETQNDYVKIKGWWFHHEDLKRIDSKNNPDLQIEKSSSVLFDPENLTI
jgi:hypothetical protein